MGGAVATSGSIATGGTVTLGGAATLGSTIATGGSVAAGGTVAIGGSSALGGNVAVGGITAVGGFIATGGIVAVGGTAAVGGTNAPSSSAATGGTAAVGGTDAAGGSVVTGGSSASDPSQCKVSPGGSTAVACGTIGTQCYPGAWISPTNNTYCASDGTCQPCTQVDSSQDAGVPCAASDCVDCCSGVHSGGNCLPAPCTPSGSSCRGADCKDCCSGLGLQGVCVDCLINSDCTCAARPRAPFSKCLYDATVGRKTCQGVLCTDAGTSCDRPDCLDCCNHVSNYQSGSQPICSCTASGQACARSDCADCCANYTSALRCVN